MNSLRYMWKFGVREFIICDLMINLVSKPPNRRVQWPHSPRKTQSSGSSIRRFTSPGLTLNHVLGIRCDAGWHKVTWPPRSWHFMIIIFNDYRTTHVFIHLEQQFMLSKVHKQVHFSVLKWRFHHQQGFLFVFNLLIIIGLDYVVRPSRCYYRNYSFTGTSALIYTCDLNYRCTTVRAAGIIAN